MRAIFALVLTCLASTAQAGEFSHFESMAILEDAEVLSAEPDGEGYRLLVRQRGVIYSCTAAPTKFTTLYEKIEFKCVDAR